MKARQEAEAPEVGMLRGTQQDSAGGVMELVGRVKESRPQLGPTARRGRGHATGWLRQRLGPYVRASEATALRGATRRVRARYRSRCYASERSRPKVLRTGELVKPRVYVETSVLSYLTALPTRNLVRAAHRQLTLDWWERRRAFELFVSQPVLEEAARGDPAAAARRLAVAGPLAVLAPSDDALELTRALLASAALPMKAWVDASHVAIAAVHGMDFLVTWNCTHIANAVMRPKIEAVCVRGGFEPPLICTPEELSPPEAT